ncbi:methylaspartate mutase [Saccharothrix sp. ALI-22-I]|nr:methylaspartate mutase [Saccharothrix sp. ALI-22-I]
MLRVLVTTVASDSHSWNLVYLQLMLEEMGHIVDNLGPCAPVDEMIARCLESRPDLVVVSSVNGHGYADGMRLISTLRSHRDLRGIPVVIGGKLGIHGTENQDHTDRLLLAGFDAVFSDGGGLRSFESFVRQLPAGAA